MDPDAAQPLNEDPGAAQPLHQDPDASQPLRQDPDASLYNTGNGEMLEDGW